MNDRFKLNVFRVSTKKGSFTHYHGLGLVKDPFLWTHCTVDFKEISARLSAKLRLFTHLTWTVILYIYSDYIIVE